MQLVKLAHAALVSFLVFVTSAVQASPVNINTASASEIAKALNGVGKSKAEAIVVYRTQNGSFKNAEDIQLVDGIGKMIYQKNAADILVD